jgi:hypothetical protein
MKFVYLLLILAGVGAYVMALLNIGNPQGELYSDIGNAILLFDIALMMMIDRLERSE